MKKRGWIIHVCAALMLGAAVLVPVLPVHATSPVQNVDKDRLEANTGGIYVEKATDVKFFVTPDGQPASVQLLKDSTSVGEMKDDGQNGDVTAGDGQYTTTIPVTINDVGKEVKFTASYDGKTTNEVVIRGLQSVTDDDLASVEAFEDTIQTVVSSFTAGDVEISDELKATILSAISQRLSSMLENGDLLYAKVSDQGFSVQLPSGLWYAFDVNQDITAEQHATVEQMEDVSEESGSEEEESEAESKAPAAPTPDEDANRWSRVRTSEVTKTFSYNFTGDAVKFEFFYEMQNIPVAIRLLASDGSGTMYSSGKDVNTEDVVFVTRGGNEVSDYTNIGYDVYYCKGITGTYNITVEIPEATEFMAVVSAAVPENWEEITTEYRTAPLKTLLWMDDTIHESFVDMLDGIIAADTKIPLNMTSVKKVEEETETDWPETIFRILYVVALILIAALVLDVYLKERAKKKHRIEAKKAVVREANEKTRQKKKQREDSLSDALAAFADEYTDDPDEKPPVQKNETKKEPVKNDSVQKDVKRPEIKQDKPAKKKVAEAETAEPLPKKKKKKPADGAASAAKVKEKRPKQDHAPKQEEDDWNPQIKLPNRRVNLQNTLDNDFGYVDDLDYTDYPIDKPEEVKEEVKEEPVGVSVQQIKTAPKETPVQKQQWNEDPVQAQMPATPAWLQKEKSRENAGNSEVAEPMTQGFF